MFSTALAQQLPPCALHRLPYTHYHEHTLKCPQCPLPSSALLLNDIFEEPILLMLSHNLHFIKYPLQKELKEAKQTLVCLLQRLQAEIKQLCHSLLSQYDSHAKCTFQSIDKINSIYRNQFYSTFPVEINKNTIEQFFLQYQENNENPSQKIQKQVIAMVQALKQRKWIDWDSLKSFYVEMTDGMKWKSFFLDKKPIFFKPNIQFKLCNSQYSCCFNESNLSLFENGQKIHEIDSGADIIYELYGFKLAAVTYDNIVIWSYLNGQLQLINQYDIKGCRELLPFQDNIAVIAASGFIVIQGPSFSCISQQQDYKLLIYFLYPNKSLHNKQIHSQAQRRQLCEVTTRSNKVRVVDLKKRVFL